MLEDLSRWFPIGAIKNISIITVGKFFAYFAGLVYVVASSYILGSEDVGRLVQVIALVRMFTLPFNFNLQSPLVKLIKERRSEPKASGASSVVRAGFLVQLLGVVGFISIFLPFLLVGVSLFPRFQDWQTALGLFALSEFLYILRRPFPSLLIAGERFGWRASFSIYTSIWRDFFTVILMIPWGVQGACLGYVLAELAVALYVAGLAVYLWGMRKIKTLLNPLSDLSEAIWTLYKNSRSNYLSNIMKRAFRELQNLLIGRFVGNAGVGYYDRARKFQKIFQFMFSPVKTYLFPRFVDKWNRSREEFYYTLRKYFYQVGTVATLVGMVLAAVAPWLVPLLFSQDFTPAIPLVWILLPAFALQQLFNVFKKLVFVINQQRSLIFESLIKFVVGVGSTFSLVYFYGYVGAAVSFLVTVLAVALYQLYFFGQNFGKRWFIPEAGPREKQNS